MKIADLLEDWAENPDHSINIKLEVGDVQLNKQLRHLPKRRLTCLANWQGKRVVAKFFYCLLYTSDAADE